MNRPLLRVATASLLYYWRTNLAVVAGVGIAVAVLSGALLAGESVRASLRDLLVQRLGATDVVVSSDAYFPEDLATRLASPAGPRRRTTSPIIRLEGSLAREGAGQRRRTVQAYGIDDRFWRFHAVHRSGPSDRTALVGAPLAEALGIKPGDDLLLRLDTGGQVPRESLFGRRETAGRTIRLTCGGILPASDLGEFALRPGQDRVLAIFVPLARLQRDLGEPSRVNTVLVASSPEPADPADVRAALKEAFTLQDIGVRVRRLASRPGVSIESARVLVDDAVARAAIEAAAAGGLRASSVFSYLANAIRANGREILYSVITAADIGQGALSSVRWIPGAVPPHPAPVPDDSIWLNEWAWRDLRASPGDAVEVDYYRWLDDGRLSTETARFRLAGAVGTGGDVDATLAPAFPGISEAGDIRSWDPPFPMDLARIRAEDEDYWERYRATPKAFVTLARGQGLWRTRFGQLSSVRIEGPAAAAGAPADRSAFESAVAAAVRERLDPEAAGIAIDAVREQGLAASRGATDFGEYFIYFSFFVIVAAVLLAGLFFRLGIEQRVREIGTLQAVGYPAATIRRLFLLEGAVLAGAGSLLGVLGAIAYGGILLAGLRTWWVGAVGTTELFLHVSAGSLAAGAATGMAAALGAVAWAIRGLSHSTARMKLAGVVEPPGAARRRARASVLVTAIAMVAAAALLSGTVSGVVPAAGGFFGAGALLLVSILGVTAIALRGLPVLEVSGRGRLALLRLGARQVTWRPGRSLLCMALVAMATFVIVSVEAFRKDAGSSDLSPTSGTGGFSLVGRTALPILQDPNSESGREALGIVLTDHPELARVRFVAFRERPGEDASCLNLYAPQEPRILGAPPSFVRLARFSFQASLATTAAEKRNPWLLLEATEPGGAIPAVADANTIQYVLHRAVGDEIVVRGDRGASVRLRLVAALRDSVLQGELLIGEAAFLRAFPDREGFRFFLLETPPDAARALVAPIEETLADWGMAVEPSADRLAAYHRVENTYLSTFQSLGGLGLLLGTVGLGAVLLRNVFERRRELALLRAVGFTGPAISLIIVAENVLLMAGGLACGVVCALVAIVPALRERGGALPLAQAAALLVVVVLSGIVSSLAAVVAARKMPLLESIRSE